MQSDPSVPTNTKVRYCPSERDPLFVVRVNVEPERVIVPTSFKARSIISKFVLTVVPQVPLCSPGPGFVIPVLSVYVVGI